MRKPAFSVLAGWTLLLLAGGVALALAVSGAGPLPGDVRLMRSLQAAVPFDSAPGVVLSLAGQVVWGLPIIAIVAALLFRQWRAALFIAAVAATSIAVSESLLPALIARPAPAADLVQVYDPGDRYSFPSGSAFLSCALLGSICYLILGPRSGRRGTQARSARLAVGSLTICLLLLVMIGVSRFYVGAHWPSDVLGGWILGGAWLGLLLAVWEGVRNR